MIINGDALTVLKRLEDNSVHCCITSSPYYGLRKYNLPPVIYGGDKNCEHVWEEVHPPGYRKSDTNPGPLQSEGNKNRQNLTSDTCRLCGAWQGELGLEPSPEQFISHLVEIFHEVKRVLRPDGLLWANIGDSYFGDSPVRKSAKEQSDPECQSVLKRSAGGDRRSASSINGCKPKDLIGVPWMLGFALRTDGWYLRSDLVWIKRNSLPSSVIDRPSSSIEHVFLLAKSRHYFYDRVAVLQKSSESYNKDKRPRGVIRQKVNENTKYDREDPQFKKQDNVGNPQYTGFNERYAQTVAESGCIPTRNFRDSDFFFKTWQGLLHNEDGEPMALVVNPRGYKGAHFACFPLTLITPMIVASTSEKGCCPTCGAPWVRIVEKIPNPSKYANTGEDMTAGAAITGNPQTSDGLHRNGGNCNIGTPVTTGWKPSCDCPNNEPVPCTVLDPFGGSGATGAAAKILGRRSIIIELKKEYCELAEQRIKEGK